MLTQTVLDFAGQVHTTSSTAATWSLFLEVGRRAGFTFGIAALSYLGRPLRERTFAQNMPRGFMEEYALRGCEGADPLATAHRSAIAPFKWHVSDWADQPSSQRWHDLMCDAGSSKLNGFSVPDRSSGSLKIIALLGTDCDTDPRTRTLLHFGALETLLRLQALGAPTNDRLPAHLSERERECLKWVMAGKTDWEISCILSLSQKTVNAYVERAKQKLGATTRAQAAVLALHAGVVI